MVDDIIQQIPTAARFTDKDAEIILKHRDLVMGYKDELVTGFYDAVFAHATTAAVFKEGERPTREQDLHHWLERSLTGPFDDEYWKWQTLVGLIHVKRKVSNAMVAGMWNWLLCRLTEKLFADLDPSEAVALINAFHALQGAVLALIAESFFNYYRLTIDRNAGLSPELLDNMVGAEIDAMVAEVRGG